MSVCFSAGVRFVSQESGKISAFLGSLSFDSRHAEPAGFGLL